MARKASKSGLGASLKKHSKDETNYGGEIVDIPPGIRGGVAKLTSGKIDTYKKGQNAGEMYLLLAGTVVEPSEHSFVPQIFEDGKVKNLKSVTMRTKGLRTQIMMPLCDTGGANPRDTDENVARALNELRKIGGDECTEDVESEDDLRDLVESLVKDGIYFKFGTSASDPTEAYPQPRTWENWNGSRDLEDYEPEDVSESAVDDNTEEDDTDSDDEPEPEKEESEDDVPFGEADDLETLGGIADDENSSDDDAENAETELRQRAKSAGISIKQIDEADSWTALANMIRDNEPEPSEGGDDDPEVGETYLCKPPRQKKEAECEITTVNKSKETVTVKRLSDGKIFKNVAWDKLSDVD